MAVDMFLKLGDIDGEAMDQAHKGEIDVLAWSWGCAQSGTMSIGGGGGSGKVSVQDVSVTKYCDTSTTNLWLKCCNGKHYEEAKLTIRKAGETPIEYIKVTMGHVLITSVSTGGSGGEDRLTENITMNFKNFKIEYTPQEATGAAGATMDIGWDIEANVQL